MNRIVFTLFGALLWVLLPAGFLVAAYLIDQDPAPPEIVPLTAALIPNTQAVSTPVDVALVWDSPQALLAPNWHGTVDRVFLGSGDILTHGTVLLSVDGVKRVGWITPGAFHRDLGIGATGVDVEMLQDALSAADYHVSATGKFDSETLAAVRAFAADLGVKDADKTTVFQAAWTIRLPVDQVKISELLVAPGHLAPGVGSELVKVSPVLTAAVTITSGALSPEQLSAATRDRTLLSLLEEHLHPLAEGTILTSYDGLALEFYSEGSALTESAIADLNGRVQSGQQLVLAQATAPVSGSYFAVPPGAIRVAPDGQTCILVHLSGPEAADPTPVLAEIIGSRYGVTQIELPDDLPSAANYLVSAGDGACR